MLSPITISPNKLLNSEAPVAAFPRALTNIRAKNVINLAGFTYNLNKNLKLDLSMLSFSAKEL